MRKFPNIQRDNSTGSDTRLGVRLRAEQGALRVHYYQVLNLLFRIETTLKLFFHLVLSSELGTAWAKTTNIETELGGSRTIAKIAKQREAQAQAFGYISGQLPAPVLALTLGELVRAMTGDAYWKFFAQYFPANQTTTRQRLLELVAVRNAFSHFRALQPTDVSRLEALTTDLLDRVDRYISGILGRGAEISLSNNEEWLQDFFVRTGGQGGIRFLTDTAERWFTIELRYRAVEIERRSISANTDPTTSVPDDAAFVVSRLNTNVLLLDEYPMLKQWTVAVREANVVAPPKVFGAKSPPAAPVFEKNVYITLPWGAVVREHEGLSLELASLLHRIEVESAMVRDHPRSRGRLVGRCRMSARWEWDDDEGWWWHEDQDDPDDPDDFFICRRSLHDDPAYWGFINAPPESFLAEARYFPWMSQDTEGGIFGGVFI